MEELAKFDGYRLRLVEESDRPKLEEWIRSDQAHRDLFAPEFFMGQEEIDGELATDPRVSCYALEDRHRTLMFIRLTRAARVHIQFPPETEENRRQQRRSLGLALIKGMAFLEVLLGRAGAAEWIFDSEAGPLRELAKGRLGFTTSPNELVRPISRLEEGV
jgi:hypothetical protein